MEVTPVFSHNQRNRNGLRLVTDAELPPRESGTPANPSSRDEAAHVLIVGENAERRSKMLSELRGLLPSGTPFVEAGETWEVLARTSGSRMVVLTGGLDGVSTHSLMRILSRRHPTLPVIAVGSRMRSTQPQDVDAALV